MKAVRRVGCALVCHVFLLGAAAYAQDEQFKEGLNARDGRRWQVAAEKMRAAIQEQRQESNRKVGERLGGILGGGTEYLPHYFLGEALFNLNDCAGAVEAWAESERQGAVQRRADFANRLRQGYATCEMRGVLPPDKFGPLLQRTTQQVADASAAAAAFAGLAQANLEIWRDEKALRDQYDRVVAEVQTARAKLASATRARASRDFADAATAAESARATTSALEASLNTVITARAAELRQTRDVEQQIATAEALERSIEGRGALSGAMAATRQQGRDALGRARDRLTAGNRGGGGRAFDEARAAALDASARFRTVLDEFERVQKSATDRRLGSSLQAAREAFSFADGAIATFDRLAAQRGPSMAPEMLERRQGLQRQIEAARRRLETARKTDDVPGIEAAVKVAVSVRGDLDTLIGSFGPPTLADRGVHPSLEEGARLFFRGDYQQAVASLSSDRFSGDVPLRLHVHLFRAASLFALYARSGGADASLRDQAQAEVNQCRQLDPDFVPDERHFSPQFLAFYRGTAPPIPVRPVPREGK